MTEIQDDSQATIASSSNTVISDTKSLTDSQIEEDEFLKCVPDSMDLYTTLVKEDKEVEVSLTRKEIQPTLIENVHTLMKYPVLTLKKKRDDDDPIECSDDEVVIKKDKTIKETKRNKLNLIEVF